MLAAEKGLLISKDRITYRKSIKNSVQLVLDGFPFTRHRIHGETIYWRCLQFRPLRCRARVRTNCEGSNVRIVRSEHNHMMLMPRRKKGSRKEIQESQKKVLEEEQATGL